MRIGVFDSGVGGLTVLKQLIEKQPKNDYIYFGDTINIPYGEKSKEQLLEYASKIIDFLISERVDEIVIACGTICSTVFMELKEKYSIKLHSIIDITIRYINHKFYNYVLVLATDASVNSHTYRDRLANHGITVCEKACSDLVPLIEKGKLEECDAVVKQYLSEIRFPIINAVLLGCTHYPIIEDTIKKYFNNGVEMINMGRIFAANVDFIKGGGSVVLYFSKIDEALEKNVRMILRKEYKIINKEL